ncbi:MAG: hypothetical protein ACRCXZ_03340 [Patescibacteria group bacterium]
MVLKFVRNAIISLVAATTMFTSSGESAQAAGNRSITNNGISINANHSGAWGIKHGKPIASQYRHDPNDPEMKVSIPSVGNGAANLIKDEATNRCLNANNAVVGSNPNWWACDSTDKDQWFTNVDSIPRSYLTGNQLNLGAGSDQRLSFVSANSSQASIREIREEFEYWIVSSAQSTSSSLNTTGHTFVALVSKETKIYDNGTSQSDGWKPWKTFGFWGREEFGVGLKVNFEPEMKSIRSIVSNGNQHYAVRKMKVSKTRAEWISSNPGYAGCDSSKYGLYGNQCVCSVFATRHWHYFTSQWDDFRPDALFNRTPEDVAIKIRAKNNYQDSDFVDYGKTWN